MDRYAPRDDAGVLVVNGFAMVTYESFSIVTLGYALDDRLSATAAIIHEPQSKPVALSK
jgi:hypothetical protein